MNKHTVHLSLQNNITAAGPGSGFRHLVGGKLSSSLHKQIVKGIE